MDAQGAADAADLDEHVDEVGFGGEEFAELVDDQDEGRDGLQGGAERAGLLVVVDVGVVACLTEQLLAAVEFTADRVAHAVHEGQIVREVGDHRGDMRQVGHTGEGGTALEVREDEVECLRGVGHREPEHEGAQQLGLAGSGGADAQAVRAHSFLRGFLQVQHHRGAVLADTDRDTQAFGAGARAPGAARLHGFRVVQVVVQVEEIGELQVGEQRFIQIAAGGRVQGCELEGECLGGLVTEAVGRPFVDEAVAGLQAQRTGTHHDREAAACAGEPAGYDLDDRDALQSFGCCQHRQWRQRLLVEYDDDVRLFQEGWAAGLEAGAAFEALLEQQFQLLCGGRDQTAAARSVASLGLDVGQPLGPLPVRGRVVPGGEGDDQVVGRVQRGEGGHHGARRRADVTLVPAEGELTSSPSSREGDSNLGGLRFTGARTAGGRCHPSGTG